MEQSLQDTLRDESLRDDAIVLMVPSVPIDRADHYDEKDVSVKSRYRTSDDP